MVILFQLFLCGYSSHSSTFLSNVDVTITSEGIYMALLAIRQSQGSLACRTCCDMGHPFIIVISEDLCMTLTPVAKRLTVERSLPVLTTQLCHSRPSRDSNTKPSACQANTLTESAVINKSVFREHCNNMSVFTLINFEHFTEKFFKTPLPFDNFASLHRQ